MSAPVTIYEPFRAGLPPLGSYLRSLWARRSFISEFSRSELREQNYGSVFGQLWLVLNPLFIRGDKLIVKMKTIATFLIIFSKNKAKN